MSRPGQPRSHLLLKLARRTTNTDQARSPLWASSQSNDGLTLLPARLWPCLSAPFQPRGRLQAGSAVDHCAGLLTLSSSKLSATSTLPFAPIFPKWSAALVGHLWCRLGYRFCSSDRKVYEDAKCYPPSRSNH